MRVPLWLGRELASWERDGLISEDQRRAILSRYRSPLTTPQLVSRTLIWLAVLSGGVGLVLLLAWNWRAIPTVVKVATATTLTAAAYGAAVLFSRRGKAAECEYAALLAGLLSGGALVVGVEAAGADPFKTPVTLWWSGVLAITAAVVPSGVVALAGTAVAVWWLLINGGTREAPWEFLVVWPVLAMAVQRDRDRFAAGGVAFSFGVWSFFAALAAWRDQGANTPVFVTTLLTGAWLDALAHAPDDRRPAFARITPALAVITLAMTMLLPSGSHRALPDARLATANAWLMLAYLAAVAVSTTYLSIAQGAWRWRPLLIAAACLGWLVTWLAPPGGHNVGPIGRWTWTLIFSGIAVMAGSSAIREFYISRDRGVFVLGVLLVLLTIGVRAVDSAAGGIAAQAGILLAAAALLAWLAHMARRAADAPACESPQEARRADPHEGA